MADSFHVVRHRANRTHRLTRRCICGGTARAVPRIAVMACGSAMHGRGYPAKAACILLSARDVEVLRVFYESIDDHCRVVQCRAASTKASQMGPHAIDCISAAHSAQARLRAGMGGRDGCTSGTHGQPPCAAGISLLCCKLDGRANVHTFALRVWRMVTAIGATREFSAPVRGNQVRGKAWVSAGCVSDGAVRATMVHSGGCGDSSPAYARGVSCSSAS